MTFERGARPLLLAVSLFTACAAPLQSSPAGAPRSTVKMDGFLPLEWDADAGRLSMRVDRLDEDFLLQVSLAAGLGSNDVGLDRNMLGDTSVVRLERSGPRVLLVRRPTRFRALSGTPAEQRAVEDSFASSVLAGFPVLTSDERGVTVDVTALVTSDVFGVSRQLAATGQGDFTLDPARSAPYLPRTRAFPRNTELEATLTFTSARAGSLVRSVSAAPDAITVRQHLSLVALPPAGYTPRRADPRVGVLGLEVYDYASPFTAALEQRWVARHRLSPETPIVYYVDRAIPRPIRDAVMEGASWWSAAFAAAGFEGGFRVELLPEDADPLDARHNVINWVHRSTRGWSLGEAMVDPRTGEILKGNVRLGSLRIRQDVLLARGLVPQDGPDGKPLDGEDPRTSPSRLALARIRQLAAHEVGHTLGLDHNMAASTQGRASVMDYPAPLVKLVDGGIDLSDAYATGVGEYDVAAIRYLYQQPGPGEDEAALLRRLARATPLFVNDPHARPVSAAHPLASVWDNGGDPVEMLRHTLEVRRIALDRFGPANLPAGEPLSGLEEILLPLYLHHRYQLEAAAKLVGGVSFSYAVKEDGEVHPPEVRRPVSPERQREALRLLLFTLDTTVLVLPERIIALIPPRAHGTEGGVAERFAAATAPTFDPIGAARAAAAISLGALLEPHRAARMVRLHAEDPRSPGFRELTDGLLEVAMAPRTGTAGVVARAVRSLVALQLMELAQAPDADGDVRAEAGDALRRLATRCAAPSRDEDERVHRQALRDDIQRFLERPAGPWRPPATPPVPPGPPI